MGGDEGGEELYGWDFRPAQDLGLGWWERPYSLRRESGLVETGAHLLWWLAVRTYLALYHRLRVVGRENLPAEPPFVLVSNHASHLDALVLGYPVPWRLCDRVFPVAASDVFFDHPLTAAVAAGLMNLLPIRRKGAGPHAIRGAMEEFRKRLLEEPCAYILFPEGARSPDGTIRRFKGGLGMLVAGTGVPVVPCHIRGAFEALPRKHHRPRPRPITLRIGPPLVFASASHDDTGWKEVARATEEAVRRVGGENPGAPG